MALSANSVDKACDVLRQVVTDLVPGYEDYDPSDPIRPARIILSSKKEDGGYESVFTDIKDITPDQEALFNSLKSAINNSPIYQDMGLDITRIGWF